MDERGYSVRGFARLCHEAAPRMSWDSWKRTINKALDEDRPYAPSLETAELWSRLLGKPADYFVRPQARTTLQEENRRLKAELEELRAELDRNRARPRSV
jgi:hypothetical protein